MTVKELIDVLSQYPDDMEVVYDVYDDEGIGYNFIDDIYRNT